MYPAVLHLQKLSHADCREERGALLIEENLTTDSTLNTTLAYYSTLFRLQKSLKVKSEHS